MGIVNIWILGNNLSQRVFQLSPKQRAVLGRVQIRRGGNVLGIRALVYLALKDTPNIIYNFPKEIYPQPTNIYISHALFSSKCCEALH